MKNNNKSLEKIKFFAKFILIFQSIHLFLWYIFGDVQQKMSHSGLSNEYIWVYFVLDIVGATLIFKRFYLTGYLFLVSSTIWGFIYFYPNIELLQFVFLTYKVIIFGFLFYIKGLGSNNRNKT